MMMINQKAATKEQADAGTWVIWDIKTCPVPDKCDASRVGLCIRRALKSLGYNGPVTITAVGMLADIYLGLLQSVSSTGIDLFHTIRSFMLPESGMGVAAALEVLLPRFPPRSNILLLSPGNFTCQLELLRKQEYNVLPQVFNAATYAEVGSLWESFLKDTMDSEEEKCSETSECEWICGDCEVDENIHLSAGRGLVNFLNHILSEDHDERALDYLRDSVTKPYLEKYNAFRDSCLESTATSVLKRKRKKGRDDDEE